MDRLVQDVRELLDHLGYAAVHLVGNSAGGYVENRAGLYGIKPGGGGGDDENLNCLLYTSPSPRD